MESLKELLTILPNFLLKFTVAMICGGVIGLERESKGKPAGFKTNILICLGSTLYMLMSEFLHIRFPGIPHDPGRIAAQVVTGIGFIGAGAIIQSQGTISGLTTAATIWVVAAIGLCIGAGFTILALIFTALVLATLVVLGKFEHRLLGKCHYSTCEVIFQDDGKTWAELSDIFREYEMTTDKYDIRKENGNIIFDVTYCDKHPSHNRFVHEMWKAKGVIEVKAVK